MSVQETAWIDATSCEGLNDIRDIPDVFPLQGVDEGMICDIQRIVSRLVSKAPHLIGIICDHLSKNPSSSHNFQISFIFSALSA